MGVYIRKMDSKEYSFLGFTNSKNSERKGKVHIGKVVAENDLANLFKSSGGYYVATLDGDMIHSKMAVLSTEKAIPGSEGKTKTIYFTVPVEDFYRDYDKKKAA